MLQAIALPHPDSIAAQSRSQSVVYVEAGAFNAQQRNRDALVSSAITLSMRRATPHLALSGSALLMKAANSSGAIQGTAGVEYLIPRLEVARLEASASATRFGEFAVGRGSSKSGFLRPHFVREQYGAFGTIGAGSVDRDSVKFHALDWDLGAWMRRGPASATFTVRHAFTNDFPLVEDFGFLLTDSTARHYAVRDVETTVSAKWKRLDLQVTGTLRNGIESTTGHAGALSAAAVLALNSRFALTVHAGEQLADFRTGVPSVRLAGASLRFNLFAPAASVPPAPAATTADATIPSSRARVSSPFISTVERHTTGGATVTIRVDASADARVEVSGSFNDWSVVPVSRTGNVYEHVLQLPAGTHRIAVRINGGEWKAPAGLARVKDDLGGEAGLVVVP